MFHVKDGKPPYTDTSQTDIGQGTIDFRPVFANGKGIEHYFMESDSAADPLALQVRNLCDVVRGTARPVVSGREGLATLKVIVTISRPLPRGRQ